MKIRQTKVTSRNNSEQEKNTYIILFKSSE